MLKHRATKLNYLIFELNYKTDMSYGVKNRKELRIHKKIEAKEKNSD